ncbi:sodium-dependent transporter [Mumia sp. Pv 4-285]|uniref:sodium-dependent transporter n=1 Tax=Mumia qirimensis TaxID=3234852 RepID=UPI00351D5283
MAHADVTADEQKRGMFNSRRVFILAAIGSAVGLGNIWRFPYVAYENGGGAFVIPYLVALLTAGIPFLFLDYALGHRNRGSAPLSFARQSRRTEGLGWWQVGICFMIGVYYAAVLAWALRYTFFSFNESWGDDPEGYFFGEFLEVSEPGVTLDPVWGVMIPLAVVWAALIAVLVLGVQKGIGMLSLIFIPILVIAFVALVARSLFLDGAMDGLDTLFTPDWEALTKPGVWAAAYGQIFFSLSIGFGIMITYSSYVKRDTDMPGSGLVVGFANSGFELLAGIGVFAALGFMAQANGVAVDEVASSGIGLAFIAFPTIISEASFGAFIGVLFFASLVIAGFTSLVSVLEVVISAVRDKFEMTRVGAVVAVSVPCALVSLVFLGTTSGLYVLDIIDNFMNKFGILFVAIVSMVVLAWVVRALPSMADHLNEYSSIPISAWWKVLVGFIAPIALAYVLVREFIDTVDTPYGGYPGWMLNVFGWGTVVAVIVFGFVATRVPWRPETTLQVPESPTPRQPSGEVR